jgi:heptosyltransferase II
MASVSLIKFLDKYVGSLTCLLLSVFNASRNKNNIVPKTILVIQLWGLGETILTLPAIKALRQKYKDSSIEVLVTDRNKEVYFNNKDIDNVRILGLNPISIKLFMLLNFKKYDLVIDMEEFLNISSIIAFFVGKHRIGYSHGIRSYLYTDPIYYNDKQHVVRTFLDLLTPLRIKKRIDRLPKLSYSRNDKLNIDKLIKKFNIGKKDFIVGFGVGAAESAKSRMWPADRYAKVADYLIKKYKAKLILIGNDEEKKFIEGIQGLMENKSNSFNAAGLINVKEMFYLISLCRLFIGNDSGPMHVAAAQGVRTIGLFGCNLPVRFGPFGKNNFAIYKKKNKNACINVHKGEVGECRFGKENSCVKKIQVNDVTKLIDKIITKKK